MKNNIRGFSLFETLVVISVFALLGILVSQSLAFSLRGSKKSEVTSRVRSTLSYAVDSISRNLRNADEITSCSTATNPRVITYTDEYGDTNKTYSFDLSSGIISSGAAELTPANVKINAVTLSCDLTSIPQSVNISLTAVDPKFSGAEGTSVTITEDILLRNY